MAALGSAYRLAVDPRVVAHRRIAYPFASRSSDRVARSFEVAVHGAFDLMGDDGFNYLNPEDRRRSNESELFSRVSLVLEEKTKLSALEARGTLAIALKVAGFLTRDVGSSELLQTLQTVLPGELRVRGVSEADAICDAIATSLRED